MDWHRHHSTRFSECLLSVWVRRRSYLHGSDCCASRNRGVARSVAVAICSICLGTAAVLGFHSPVCLADSLVRSDDTVVSITVASWYEIVRLHIVVQRHICFVFFHVIDFDCVLLYTHVCIHMFMWLCIPCCPCARHTLGAFSISHRPWDSIFYTVIWT